MPHQQETEEACDYVNTHYAQTESAKFKPVQARATLILVGIQSFYILLTICALYINFEFQISKDAN